MIYLLAWKKRFLKQIISSRKELKYQSWILMISALNTIIEIDLSVIVTFISVIVLIISTNLRLNPAYVVYAAAFYTRLNGTLGYFLSKAIKNGANTLVSIQRVEVKNINFFKN
jgi:hypothetical protein